MVNLILTPANMDDRVPAPDLLMATDSGITIGDLGYRGKKFQDLLIEEVDMLMLTRADATDRKKASFTNPTADRNNLLSIMVEVYRPRFFPLMAWIVEHSN